jgi:hypothetical protein
MKTVKGQTEIIRTLTFVMQVLMKITQPLTKIIKD